MIPPFAVAAAATEVTRQAPALREWSYGPINRPGRASSTFTAGGEGEAATALDEQGVHVRRTVRLHLGQCDRSSYNEDVTAWESQHRLLEGVVDERPESLSTESHPKERRLVLAVDEGGLGEPGVAACGRLVQLYERDNVSTRDTYEALGLTVTWLLPAAEF